METNEVMEGGEEGSSKDEGDQMCRPLQVGMPVWEASSSYCRT